MVDEAALTVTGRPIADTTIELLQGWNLVGYNSTETQPRNTALSTIADSCVCVWTYDNYMKIWTKYIPDGLDALNNLVEMGPDRGYWICVEENCDWRVSPYP